MLPNKTDVKQKAQVFSCCCYTTNERYLLPTILSASQMRANANEFLIDIQVICFGSLNDSTQAAADYCNNRKLNFLLLPVSELQGYSMTYARFMISSLLDKKYNTVIYIDGDTQIVGSISPLIEFDIPYGNILAVRDPMTLKIHSKSIKWEIQRNYFNSIGIHPELQSQYFNAGMIRFYASDWVTISQECLKVYKSDKYKFKFNDQDILNIVIGINRSLASLKWNFPAFLMNYGAKQFVTPAIYHFMSNPRPWHGSFPPWGEEWYRPYVDLIKQEPKIAASLITMPLMQVIKYRIKQNIKVAIESHSWGMRSIGDNVILSESNSVV